MPEPAGPDGDIALGREPMGSMRRAGWGILFADVAGGGGAAGGADRIVGSPAWIAGDAAFVADPTDIWADVAEDTGVRLEFAD